MIPLVDLRAQYLAIQPDIDAAIQRVLTSTGFIMGKEVSTFESAFAEYCGAGEGIGVASGTAALHIALRACGIGEGDEVITSPFTFMGTAEAILHAGATPVFSDIDPISYNLDPLQVEDRITDETKAIIPVHLYGHPADMGSLLEIAERRGLKVIEDAAQAHGSEYRGRRAGSMGDAACFSFYPAKNLGAYGDAGMIVTGDPDIAGEARLLRDHGRQGKYEHLSVGFGERLDALQAAILGAKLPYLDEWVDARRQVATQYVELLSGRDVGLPSEADDVKHSYHQFVVRLKDRDACFDRMTANGIGAGVHYPMPLHLQPALNKLGYRPGDFPNSEQAAKEVMSLPIFPEITMDQVAEVARLLTSGSS